MRYNYLNYIRAKEPIMKNGKFEQKDLEELNRLYEEVLGPATCSEFRDMVDELIEGNIGPSPEDRAAVEFWNVVKESLSDIGSLVLYDVRDEDGYAAIKGVMETLHYDNGKPLSCDEYDYFDHYDRDQDFYSFYDDELIDHFELNEEGNLIIVMVMNKKDLVDCLTDLYDGSSWEHDFGNN